jgi:hypothetical protein
MHSFFLKSYFGLLYVSGVTGVVNIGGQESSAMKPRRFFKWQIHPCRGFFLFLDFVLLSHPNNHKILKVRNRCVRETTIFWPKWDLTLGAKACSHETNDVFLSEVPKWIDLPPFRDYFFSLHFKIYKILKVRNHCVRELGIFRWKWDLTLGLKVCLNETNDVFLSEVPKWIDLPPFRNFCFVSYSKSPKPLC